MSTRRNRALPAIAALGALWLSVAAGQSAPVKIAVFDFELEDVSAAALQAGHATAGAVSMEKVGNEARRVLAQSGRYSIIDVSKLEDKPVTEKSLRNCDGCEAGIALRLGADQSLIGVVRRVSMTDYYVVIQITDARTGKVLNQSAANFAGGAEGWASGAVSLIRHLVLAPPEL